MPASMGNQAIVATPSCAVVGCYPSQDGSTSVQLGPAVAFLSQGTPAFDGSLHLPTRRLEVTTVEGAVVLAIETGSTRPRVRIWTNHPRWPDRILIGLD